MLVKVTYRDRGQTVASVVEAATLEDAMGAVWDYQDAIGEPSRSVWAEPLALTPDQVPAEAWLPVPEHTP